MSETMKIPYNTWGGVNVLNGETSAVSRTYTVDNPYTIQNLQFNCRVNSFINIEDTRTIVMNMANYARLNIANYNIITSIPEEHSPNSINTSLAQDWYSAFNNCRSIINLPDPFYDTSNATNMSYMIRTCLNLTTVPNFDTSNVTDMSSMFSSCYNISTVPNFDTSNECN